MAANIVFGSPIPLSEIESVLAWVDTFKLSRPTKKIHRDFSDAVMLAEILLVHYPKLVEMHNYPPRNSHALKLNNWMTLNRKVLKKLKLNLCANTLEQLANSSPGIIERVLIMVRDKIKRDQDAEKANTSKDAEHNMSSGGSYYEACGDDGEQVLVVPVKMRVNGVLETVQQKVVSYDAFINMKEELKDAKESVETLRQKLEHLDSLIKLKDERIIELQKQLDRKQSRRKDTDILQQSNSATSCLPYEEPPEPVLDILAPNIVTSKHSIKSTEFKSKPDIVELKSSFVKQIEVVELKSSSGHIGEGMDNSSLELKMSEPKITSVKNSRSRISISQKSSLHQVQSKTHDMDVDDGVMSIEGIKSDVFKEIENSPEPDGILDDEFKDSEPGMIKIADMGTPSEPGFIKGADMRTPSEPGLVKGDMGAPTTIQDAIQKEETELSKPIDAMEEYAPPLW